MLESDCANADTASAFGCLEPILSAAGIRGQRFCLPITSQIVPVIIGDSTATVSKAQQLQTAGFYVMPVRPPTVPQGSSRLRICLNTQFETADLTPLLDLL